MSLPVLLVYPNSTPSKCETIRENPVITLRSVPAFIFRRKSSLNGCQRLLRNIVQHRSDAERGAAFAGAVAATGAENQTEFILVNAEFVLDAVALAL